MNYDNSFQLWPIVPFGAEGEDGTSGAVGADGKPVVTPVTGKPDAKADTSTGKTDDSDDDGDDDDEFKRLSVVELRRIAADNAKKAKAAEKEAKKFKDAQDAEERKKNDENTNLKKDVADANTTIATLRATMTKQAIESAIRDDKRFEWHDVEMVATVAAKLNSEGIKVSDDGKVEGLKVTLPKVAKEHPFMLVKDNTADGGNNGKNGPANNGGNNGSGSGPTGFQPGQGRTSGGSGNEPDAKKLAEYYPALASRI